MLVESTKGNMHISTSPGFATQTYKKGRRCLYKRVMITLKTINYYSLSM